jgi:hypothetical protein
MRIRWTMFLAAALLASPANAARDCSTDVVRDLAVRVGPIVGGALACREIVRSRLQVIVDKFHTVIRDGADPRFMSGVLVSQTVPIEALKRTGPQIDTERVVKNLETVNNFDLGIGSTLNFGHGVHQASHKIWGTALDEAGIFRPIDLE